jgi:hypothetical protein
MSDILKFSANIADAEAPPALPAGSYEAICVAATPGVSKSSGNPTLPLQFKINKSQFPADFETDAEEITLTLNSLTVRDTAQDRFRLKGICSALGVPMSNNIDPNDFIMKACRLETKVAPGLDGSPRAEIAKVLPL